MTYWIEHFFLYIFNFYELCHWDFLLFGAWSSWWTCTRASSRTRTGRGGFWSTVRFRRLAYKDRSFSNNHPRGGAPSRIQIGTDTSAAVLVYDICFTFPLDFNTTQTLKDLSGVGNCSLLYICGELDGHIWRLVFVRMIPIFFAPFLSFILSIYRPLLGWGISRRKTRMTSVGDYLRCLDTTLGQ